MFLSGENWRCYGWRSITGNTKSLCEEHESQEFGCGFIRRLLGSDGRSQALFTLFEQEGKLPKIIKQI